MGEYFDCGRKDSVPETIESGQVRSIAVRNCDGELMGVKGILKYKLAGHPEGVYMTIYFENPYYGRNYHNVQFWHDDVTDNELYLRIHKVNTENVARTHWSHSIYGASSMTDGNNSSMGIGLSAGKLFNLV